MIYPNLKNKTKQKQRLSYHREKYNSCDETEKERSENEIWYFLLKFINYFIRDKSTFDIIHSLSSLILFLDIWV